MHQAHHQAADLPHSPTPLAAQHPAAELQYPHVPQAGSAEHPAARLQDPAAPFPDQHPAAGQAPDLVAMRRSIGLLLGLGFGSNTALPLFAKGEPRSSGLYAGKLRSTAAAMSLYGGLSVPYFMDSRKHCSRLAGVSINAPLSSRTPQRTAEGMVMGQYGTYGSRWHREMLCIQHRTRTQCCRNAPKSVINHPKACSFANACSVPVPLLHPGELLLHCSFAPP